MLQRFREIVQERVTNSQMARFGLSLVIALFLWGWVTLLQDPVQTQRYAEVAMSAPDLPGALQIVTSLPRATVTVTDVSSRLDQLTRADITVSLDTSKVNGPGSYQLDVIAETDENVRELKVSPDTVSVEIEEEISRNLPLTVENQQLADDSRRVIDVNPEVSEVTVTGTRSAVDRIEKVVLPVRVENQTGDFVDMIEPYAVDKDNQRIQEVTIVPAHIRTEVVLEKRGKTVSVVPQVTGTPADGYVVQQTVAVPATVIVDGPADLLDNLLFISTAPVDITGAREAVSQTVPLVGLPRGVTLVDPPKNEVEVRVAIGTSGGTANLIPDMPIEVRNLRDGLTARLDPQSLDISVSAPTERLSELTAEDISVTVDVSGLGPGVYTLTPEITVPDDVTVTTVDPQRVVVLISETGATPAPSTADPADVTVAPRARVPA
jgi:YbbR domain-containing protein